MSVNEPLFIDKEDPAEPLPVPSEEGLAEFKQQLASWVELQKKISLLKIAIRERQAAQRRLEPLIQSFMSTYGYDNVSTQEGSIRLSNRKTKTSIKMKDLRKRVEEKYGEDALKLFDDGRSIVEIQKLKMILPKMTMNLKI